MATEFSLEELRGVWQNQTPETSRMAADEIRKRSEKLDKRFRRRNNDVLAVCFTVMVCFSVSLLVSPLNLFQRVGALLTIFGGGYLAFQIRANQLKARVLVTMAAKIGGVASVEFYRAALERERDFYRGISLWSRFIMLAPGLPVLCIGEAVAHPDEASTLRGIAVICILFWVAVVWLSLRKAHQEQRQINELDALMRESQ